MTRSLSQDLQNSLRSLLSEPDMSFDEIAQRLHVSKPTVSRYCNSWGIAQPDNLGGRPSILTKTSKALMKRMVLTGELKTVKQVHQHFVSLYPNLTYYITLSALKSMGFKICSKRKHPFYTRSA
ncbi:hypothetical protein BCV72DRAFT_320539 [Rhizopus microsporus var. microsporus]|uniref:Uncharacterized protein n=2 Tax=Rhizopus microsporus TaxID=58291 RepID=A0A2G4T5Q7_RHIZD|nr:uncharacterized protein RHIMIDRAFT_300735 [Rhizopus microsporus ATCC 52813]ORE01688.1 hypothetical protein BCV72DRAFT_320539 [Rhizopus microsporus var. microsporus]PHZ16338.1 hypothetical protein RHIMIDRAFT_300735 [Rhizopus microsporus ATCC 52813]